MTIRVIGEDLMCFDVDSTSLEPLHTGCYDPYAWTDPLPGYEETISIGEWNRRRSEQRRRQFSGEQ